MKAARVLLHNLEIGLDDLIQEQTGQLAVELVMAIAKDNAEGLELS